VLYLKRPRVKIYRSDAVCTGASDTATWRKPPRGTMGFVCGCGGTWGHLW